jgi:hypothetical protein
MLFVFPNGDKLTTFPHGDASAAVTQVVKMGFDDCRRRAGTLGS